MSVHIGEIRSQVELVPGASSGAAEPRVDPPASRWRWGDRLRPVLDAQQRDAARTQGAVGDG